MDLRAAGASLASIYRGSPWIVVADAAAGATTNVAQLREWGVDRILVVSAVEGVGPQPEADVHLTGAQAATMMGGIRAFEASLQSSDVIDAVSDFDPFRTARVLAPPFGMGPELAGRRAYGSSRPEWRALEDKTTIDAEFRKAGIETAPSAVVPVAEAPDVAHRLGGEGGTVWVADNREGWHGGGEYVRRVRSGADVAWAVDWFGARAERVRVMPFLEGLPCSIHGYVTSRGVAAFRPVEMLIAHRRGHAEFRYLGMATTWDPPAGARRQMRQIARRMATYLASTVRYRGPFSIDGVLTTTGFLPTELNPRMSAGFGVQAAKVPDLQIGLLTRAVVEGDVDVDAKQLEERVVTAADRQRTLRIGIPVPEPRANDSIPIVIAGDEVRRSDDGVSHGTLDIGSAPSGSYVLIRPDQEHIPVGPSAANLAVSTATLAAETWALDLGDLQPPREVDEAPRDVKRRT